MLITILLAISFIFSACRSRKKAVEYISEQKREVLTVDSAAVTETEEKVQAVKTEKKKEETKSNQAAGEVEIKGNANGANPFKYENIVNGDTLQTITINGNADFVIRNRFTREETIKAVENFTENLDIVATVARKAVAQSTIKDVAHTIKKVEKSTSSKGFGFPVYLFGFLFALIAFVLWFVWKKYGSSVSTFIGKFKK